VVREGKCSYCGQFFWFKTFFEIVLDRGPVVQWELSGLVSLLDSIWDQGFKTEQTGLDGTPLGLPTSPE
jgi:hypothetical protein